MAFKQSSPIRMDYKQETLCRTSDNVQYIVTVMPNISVENSSECCFNTDGFVPINFSLPGNEYDQVERTLTGKRKKRRESKTEVR